MITPDKFSIEESLAFGWRTMTGKFGTMMLYVFLPALLTIVVHIGVKLAIHADKPSFDLPNVLATILIFIIQLAVALGIYRVTLRLVDGEPPSFNDFLFPPLVVLGLLGAQLLLGLIVTLGLILLIIPGIIWYIQFHYYCFAIADRQVGPIAALNLSSQITKGARWRLFLFGVVCTVINVAGLICLIVGIIPSSMVTLLASAHVYRQLLKNTEASVR